MTTPAPLYSRPYTEVNMQLFRSIGLLMTVFSVQLFINVWKYRVWWVLIPAFVLLLLGLFLLTAREVMEIAADGKHYRHGTSFFGWHFGSWYELPVPLYLTCYPERSRTMDWIRPMRMLAADDHFKLALVYDRNHQIPLGLFPDREEALKISVLVAKKLKVRLLDCTKGDPHWEL